MTKIHNSCGLCRIDIENLTVKSGNNTLIDNINISFHCGQLTALIGRNGAGKTTLIKSILGEKKYSGNISYKEYNNNEIKRPCIGYVPQNISFDKYTPISVIDFLSSLKQKEPIWLGHKKTNYNEIKNKLIEMNCEHIINRKLGEISGGELQRVLLTAALDPIPDFLILDEPVSGVDINGLDLFYKSISKIRDNYHIAILLVSHDLSLIKKYADNVVLIDKTILENGNTNYVFKTNSFKKIFGFMELEV